MTIFHALQTALRDIDQRARRSIRTQNQLAHRRGPLAAVGDALITLGETFGGRHPDPPPPPVPQPS